MANAMPTYPRHLFSRLLDQVFVANSQVEERQLLERHNWRAAALRSIALSEESEEPTDGRDPGARYQIGR